MRVKKEDNHSMETQGLPLAAVDALAQGRKIEAIRIVRLERGIGLKEAKDAVEEYVRTRPDVARQSESASKVRILLLIVVIVIFSFWFVHR